MVPKAENMGLAQTQINKMLGSTLVPLFPYDLDQNPHPINQSAHQGKGNQTMEEKGHFRRICTHVTVVRQVGVERIKELFLMRTQVPSTPLASRAKHL